MTVDGQSHAPPEVTLEPGVLVVDLLGYGRSDRPLAHPVTIRAHAERVIALFDAHHHRTHRLKCN